MTADMSYNCVSILWRHVLQFHAFVNNWTFAPGQSGHRGAAGPTTAELRMLALSAKSQHSLDRYPDPAFARNIYYLPLELVNISTIHHPAWDLLLSLHICSRLCTFCWTMDWAACSIPAALQLRKSFMWDSGPSNNSNHPSHKFIA